LGSLKNHCEDIGAKVGEREAGCTEFYPSTHTCVINVLNLRSSEDRDQMNVWGHELAHCKYGKYHTVNGEK
jgi:hypothetical protein